jgi:hypothetical protein
MSLRGPVTLSAPIDPVLAAGMLADWGFLAHPDLPNGTGDAYLLVAMRDAPTLRHFDPERVEVWVNRGSKGTRLQITRRTHPLDTDYSWGTISIVDRFGISNEYVTFGGRLTVTEVDGATVVVFVSSAPILRRGGHSQGWDEAAVDLAAFFGRVMIAVDYVPGFETRIAESRPLVRYAAFVADSSARYRPAAALRAIHPALWRLLRGEELRLGRDHPAEWAEGVALATAAGLEGPTGPG